jgi:thiol-disulfide isomerase/thioredoxin
MSAVFVSDRCAPPRLRGMYTWPAGVLAAVACAMVLAAATGCSSAANQPGESARPTYWTTAPEFGGGLTGPSAPEGIVAIRSAEEFEEKVLQSDMPVLVEFYKPGCGGCILLAPVLTSIQPEYEGSVRFVTVDSTKPPNYSIVRGSGVRATPTCLVFVDGEEVARILGERSQGDMRRFIDSAVEKGSAS